ncbi:hypothetical protein [Aminipila terrae]|uniref:DUF2232 domain-containing protein n=1 Tax=Aminipila terrae TaxID=2697030 RepID=A0A6P1MLJ4_9FIRM|nr:hypothetical protein [Aminipila terrae]QHI71855.1 hypothetical protein Ami3637_05150 [Aminipila terrae]
MGKDTPMKSKNNKIVALGGVLLALSLVALYAASFVPGFEITLYTVSSVFVPIMMIESRGKGGWILYIACSIMSLLLLPNKLAAFPYIFFFGIYGIIKYYIEKIKNSAAQLSLKFLVFTTIMVVAYRFFYSIFFSVITLKDMSPVILLIMGELFFLVYDIILTGIINYYYRRFYGRI